MLNCISKRVCLSNEISFIKLDFIPGFATILVLNCWDLKILFRVLPLFLKSENKLYNLGKLFRSFQNVLINLIVSVSSEAEHF